MPTIRITAPNSDEPTSTVSLGAESMEKRMREKLTVREAIRRVMKKRRDVMRELAK